MIRNISFSDALSEGLVQAMDKDISIFVTGIGVDYASGVFGTTKDAFKKFGKARVFESPAMENAITGICIGAAASGSRPLLVHYRNDFLLLSLDQLMNLAAKWNYMYGGNAPAVPVVIRAIIGRGWGQGATHSQSLQSVLAHFPGVAVVMPTFPEDAKGLLLSAFESKSPVVLLEHRSLFDLQGNVPLEPTKTPIGKAKVIRQGADVTIVACSIMVLEALSAAKYLSNFGIDVEVIDLISIRPLDELTILNSVIKTGRLLVADTSWVRFGVTSEVTAMVTEKAFSYLKCSPVRIGLPDCPAPVTKVLEDKFYPNALDIIDAVRKMLNRNDIDIDFKPAEDTFKGPY